MAIKKVVPGIPIILLTGFGDLMNAAGESPPGVDAILGKPVQFPQLAQTIATLTTRGDLVASTPGGPGSD